MASAEIVESRCVKCGWPHDKSIDNMLLRWTINELNEGARNGCARCSVLLRCLQAAYPAWPQSAEGGKAATGVDVTAIVALPYEFARAEVFFDDGKYKDFVCMYAKRPDYSSLPFYFEAYESARHLPGSTSSSETFTTIKSWINDCTQSHPRCRQEGIQSGKFSDSPKRLLDMRSPSKVVLREKLSEELHWRCRYACLSHCWGPVALMAKTTTANLAAFKTEVPRDSLTRTFQDAISICRRLDIGYLWIDALCIVQDSEEDWNDQAAKMADIYENAFLTIAASHAKDSSEGCFTDTNPRFLTKQVTGHPDIFVRHPAPSAIPPYEMAAKMHHDALDNFPILKRGWIYQEIRLSSRVLHFCAENVLWECRTLRADENGLYYSLDPEDYEPHDNFRLYSLDEHDARGLWYRTVEEYGGLKLTYAKDRLPALSALVQRMERQRRNDRYLAGLWEETLLFDLLWHVTAHVEEANQTGMAPSWSWISTNNPVQWLECRQTLPLIKELSIRYQSTGLSHMGQFSEAAIDLCAPLIPAELLIQIARANPSRSQPKYSDLPTATAEVMDAMIERLREPIREDELHDALHIEFVLKNLILDNGKMDLTPKTETRFIMIGKNPTSYTMFGLHLRKVTPGSTLEGTLGERAIYQRIGYVQFYHRMTVEEILMRGLSGGYKKTEQLADCVFERMVSILKRLEWTSITLV